MHNCRYTALSTVWPHLAKFRHFCTVIKVWGQFLVRFISSRQPFYRLGQFLCYWGKFHCWKWPYKKCLTIWSHCLSTISKLKQSKFVFAQSLRWKFDDSPITTNQLERKWLNLILIEKMKLNIRFADVIHSAYNLYSN